MTISHIANVVGSGARAAALALGLLFAPPVCPAQAQPAALTKWLYKEVLHADLDDPYLGLGPALFASYPFAKEDKN